MGKDAVKDGYDEDGGFAINGGKGWKNVEFNNHQVTSRPEPLSAPDAIAVEWPC